MRAEADRSARHEKPVVAALVVIAALAYFGSSADRAAAAPCPAPTYGLAAGVLSIQGTVPCSEEEEEFAVFCEAGTIRFEYTVNGVLQGSNDTTVGCGSPTRLEVHGRAGNDTIDLSRVTAANGFTGIAEPNLIDGGSDRDQLIASQMASELLGGPQNDIILARNGAHDTVDCGEGTDAALSDQAGVDALSNCEVVDLLPTAAAPAATPSPTPTGRRAAAQRRCRKLKRRSARRRCLRHARTLPV
jgi:hypothetical protein